MKNHDIFEQTLGPKEFNSEDLKDKLKNQLRELDIFASSIENSKITTPSKVVPSSVNKSFTNLNWPPQTPKESSREKSTNPGSVSDSLKVMQEGIDLLSRQVQNLESVIQKKDLRHVLSRVKDEIIADLRSTSNKSYAFDFDEKFAEAFERSMNDWDERVLTPRLQRLTDKLEQRLSNSRQEEEDPRDIMKRIQEKMELKTKKLNQLQNKRSSSRGSLYDSMEESRIRATFDSFRMP